MNLNELRSGELKAAFDALEEAFEKLHVDFYLIGALARDIWYSQLGKQSRTTKDVDFAVMIGSKADYEAVRSYLTDNKNFAETKNHAFVMISPAGIEIDILPFGGIEIDEEVKLTETGLSGIKVNGFMEVYQAGTEKMEVSTGHSFEVATLPAIVLLKLIAFDDRPEMRYKDARDIVNIIDHYFDLQAEFIYEHHADIFGGEDMDLNMLSAIVIGREMKKIVNGNDKLHERLTDIVGAQIMQREDSAFIRNMVSESGKSVEEMVTLLEKLLQGFNSYD